MNNIAEPARADGFWFLSGTVWHRTMDGHSALCVAAKQWSNPLTVWASPGAPPPYLSCWRCFEALKTVQEREPLVPRGNFTLAEVKVAMQQAWDSITSPRTFPQHANADMALLQDYYDEVVAILSMQHNTETTNNV